MMDLIQRALDTPLRAIQPPIDMVDQNQMNNQHRSRYVGLFNNVLMQYVHRTFNIPLTEPILPSRPMLNLLNGTQNRLDFPWNTMDLATFHLNVEETRDLTKLVVDNMHHYNRWNITPNYRIPTISSWINMPTYSNPDFNLTANSQNNYIPNVLTNNIVEEDILKKFTHHYSDSDSDSE